MRPVAVVEGEGLLVVLVLGVLDEGHRALHVDDHLGVALSLALVVAIVKETWHRAFTTASLVSNDALNTFLVMSAQNKV